MHNVNCFPFMTISSLYHHPLSSNGPGQHTVGLYSTQLALWVSQHSLIASYLSSPSLSSHSALFHSLPTVSVPSWAPLSAKMFPLPVFLSQLSTSWFLLIHMHLSSLLPCLVPHFSFSLFLSLLLTFSPTLFLVLPLQSTLNSGSCVAFLNMTPGSKVS